MIKNTIVSVRLSEAEMKLLNMMAEHQSLNKSEVIRNLLIDGLQVFVRDLLRGTDK